VKQLDPPIPDPDWQGHVIAESTGFRWLAVRQLFNWRLVGVAVDAEPMDGATWGWCYTDPHALAAAVRIWDPGVQDEPLGWHKRPTDTIRKAPHRAEDPEYNRPRCVHGNYIDTSTACGHDPYCPDFAPSRRQEASMTAR
jgi:hypothetical protein